MNEPEERQDLLLSDTAAEIEQVFDVAHVFPETHTEVTDEVEPAPRMGWFASLLGWLFRPARKVRDRQGVGGELGEEE